MHAWMLLACCTENEHFGCEQLGDVCFMNIFITNVLKPTAVAALHIRPIAA